VVTNIANRCSNRDLVKGATFRIGFGHRDDARHHQVHKTYGDVPHGERLAFFGDGGYLEIAVNKGVEGAGGGAAQLLGLQVTDAVRLELEAVTRSVARA
jgi:S-adenosylmethionine hydrolase